MSKDACRPFSANRNGMVQGEGAAIFVFEEYEHARARGADILVEVSGFAMTSDAADIVMPSKHGAGRAIAGALKDARINPEEVDTSMPTAQGRPQTTKPNVPLLRMYLAVMQMI